MLRFSKGSGAEVGQKCRCSGAVVVRKVQWGRDGGADELFAEVVVRMCLGGVQRFSRGGFAGVLVAGTEVLLGLAEVLRRFSRGGAEEVVQRYRCSSGADEQAGAERVQTPEVV